jgi:hypothetical protein
MCLYYKHVEVGDDVAEVFWNDVRLSQRTEELQALTVDIIDGCGGHIEWYMGPWMYYLGVAV